MSGWFGGTARAVASGLVHVDVGAIPLSDPRTSSSAKIGAVCGDHVLPRTPYYCDLSPPSCPKAGFFAIRLINPEPVPLDCTREKLKAETEKAVRALAKELETATIEDQ